MTNEITENLEIAVDAEAIVEIEAAELDLREDMSFCSFWNPGSPNDV